MGAAAPRMVKARPVPGRRDTPYVTDRSRVLRFNIWPDRHRKPYYWRVFVFGSRRAMLIFFREQTRLAGITGDAAREDFGAITRSWTILKIRVVTSRRKGASGRRTLRWVQDNCVGQILFYRQHLGAGVVAHECLHAALQWAHYYGKIPAASLYVPDGARTTGGPRDGNERLCQAEQRLVSAFWRNFYARAPKHWYRKR